MSYKVIKRFMDLEDNNFIYEEGFEYPRKGHYVSENRLKELSSENNKQGIPLIEKVGKVEVEPKKANIDEIAPAIDEIEVKDLEKAEKPKKKKK